MSSPRVSVVMTTYNGERFLGKAIESVLFQSYKDLELIVVDDGSTDSSAPIIRSFCARDSRVRGIFLNRNVGIPKAANRGLRVTRGKYIARMDSDDLCHPDRLAKQVAYLERYSEIFVLGCRTANIDEHDKKKNNAKDDMPFGSGHLLIARRMADGDYLVVHATLMVRKFCFDELGGYRECFPIGEDLDFYTRMLERYGTVFENLSERLYYHRRYNQSITKVYSLDIHIKIQTLIVYSKFYRTHSMNDPLAKIKKLNFRNLPLPNIAKKCLEEIVFLFYFSSTLYQGGKIFSFTDILRVERLLLNLPWILQVLPSSLFLYIKDSRPFMNLARVWIRHGYLFMGAKCIIFAFMTDPLDSLIFCLKKSKVGKLRFARRLFCVCS